MKGQSARILIGVVALASPLLASAQNERGHSGLRVGTSSADSTLVLRFVDSLKAAVLRGDRHRVAKMIDYPIEAWDGSRSRTIRSEAALLAHYQDIFSPSLRRAIVVVEVDSLFSNWQGIMFGSGRVWFRTVAPGVLKIETINPPVEALKGSKKPASIR